MGISYRKLWVLLAEKEISKQEFRENLGIASGTMTRSCFVSIATDM